MRSTMSKSKSKNAGKSKDNEKLECDLCCMWLAREIKDQDCLKCEGACGCVVHRHCAGVTKTLFEKINHGDVAFVCQYCELNLAKAVYQQTIQPASSN